MLGKLPAPKLKKTLVAIGVHAIGLGLIVAAFLTGPLIPGPNGTLLLLAGLHIIGKHNKYARKLEVYVITQHNNLASRLFGKNKYLQLLWDVLIYAFLLVAGYLLIVKKVDGLAAILLGAGIFYAVLFWFYNRLRWQKLKAFYGKVIRKKKGEATNHQPKESSKTVKQTPKK